MNNILLLEDDISLSELLKDFLESKGFLVSIVDNAESCIDLAYEKHFDLWIFDVKIIGGDGFSVLAQLRKMGKKTPCIFLTSLSMIDDIKMGFESGCDDYLKKPFDVEELLLRINSLLKRKFLHNESNFLEINNEFKFEMIKKILYRNEEIINLTNKERELLVLLLEKRGEFIQKDEIFSRLWGYEEESTDMALRVYIKNLRKILGKDMIETQRFRGYRLC